MYVGPGIALPRRCQRTPTERFRDAVYARRALTDRGDRGLRLAGVYAPSPGLGPPAGMFKFTDAEKRP